MSKIRPVRQRTDAPRQDEGPSTGAALLAGAVLGLATDAVALALPRQLSARRWPRPAGCTSDSRLPTAAGPPCSCRPASCSGSRRWPPWPSSATRRACSVPAGWRTLPGTPCTTETAGPPGTVLVPAALHRLRRGPRCAAAHRPALAGGQLGQRFAGWGPGAGLAGRTRISHPWIDHRTAHVSTERTVKSLPDGQLIRLLAGV